MTDYANLCAKLREWFREHIKQHPECVCNAYLALDAVDAIDALMAENFARAKLVVTLTAEVEQLTTDAERLDWLDTQVDDWTYKASHVWKIVGPKLSIREAIDSTRPVRFDAAMEKEEL